MYKMDNMEKCDNDDCPKALMCYRQTSCAEGYKNGYRQHYVLFEYEMIDGVAVCKYFIRDKRFK
jgi:hypothetical protein